MTLGDVEYTSLVLQERETLPTIHCLVSFQMASNVREYHGDHLTWRQVVACSVTPRSNYSDSQTTHVRSFVAASRRSRIVCITRSETLTRTHAHYIGI